MTTQTEALKLALEALEESWHLTPKPDYARVAITAIKEALAQTQEPVAWRTFDGEGGYDYRSYEDNESYADDWDKRNPNHKGWVDKLYTHSQRTWVGLTGKEAMDVTRKEGHELLDFIYEYGTGSEGVEERIVAICKAIDAKLKQKNGYAEEKNT